MSELNVTGSNLPPRPIQLSEAWKNGLTAHIKNNLSRFGTQKNYAESIGISPIYISKILNLRYYDFTHSMLISIADKCGYDKVPRKPERAVEFENSKERERVEHIDPDKKSKDLRIIDDYLERRSHIKVLPQELRRDFIVFMLQGVIKDLNEVTTEQVC